MFKIFEALTIFDWITPLWGIFQDIRHDPTIIQTNSWTFFIPYEQSIQAGWNARDIQNMLRNYGIENWGSQITNGQLFFSVYLKDAQFAEFLMQQRGVPIDEKFVGAPSQGDLEFKTAKDQLEVLRNIPNSRIWDW